MVAQEHQDRGKPKRESDSGPGCGSVVLGVVLVLIGIPLLVLPGPGVVLIVAGVGMIATGLGMRQSRKG